MEKIIEEFHPINDGGFVSLMFSFTLQGKFILEYCVLSAARVRGGRGRGEGW